MTRCRNASASGLTLIEVLIALFIMTVGIVGVLAALPTGINSAALVVFQDAALHLSASKFAEFRRDRVDPATDLLEGSTYMTARQEPLNAAGWHDFARGPGQTYEYFDGIERYAWRVEQTSLQAVGAGNAGNPAPPADAFAPVHGGGTPLNLTRVVVVIHQKGSTREFRFTEYLSGYGRTSPADSSW